jgi:hypothetical protein
MKLNNRLFKAVRWNKRLKNLNEHKAQHGPKG